MHQTAKYLEESLIQMQSLFNLFLVWLSKTTEKTFTV